MEGRTSAPVSFDSTPITVLPTPPVGAQEMELVVYDPKGREVARDAIPVSSEPILWAGVQQDGQPVAAGLYRFEVEATGVGGIQLPTTQADTYARIAEVQTIGAEARVIFEGGAEAPASAITALRAATG
jgi:flagellar basal-body rod modification protein FlgD